MTIHFSAVGLVVADLDRSFACYRVLGLDLPTEAPEVPHFEVTLPGGLRLMWDTVESVRSFDPEFEPSSGGGAALAFDCGSPEAVDEALAALIEAGCTSTKAPGTHAGDSATRVRSIPTATASTCSPRSRDDSGRAHRG